MIVTSVTTAEKTLVMKIQSGDDNPLQPIVLYTYLLYHPNIP